MKLVEHGMNCTHKILESHKLSGEMIIGEEIELRIDQTLTQDATGTMSWLQFEALGVDKVKTDLSVSYVDHNTLQMGFRNPDDHRFLQTSAEKFGAVFSPAGTGICHQLHLENFGKPGKTLLGSDSHTPTGGGIGMLAMGAGGLSVALAMAGQGYKINMPKVVGVKLKGKLQGFAQAKDIILYLLGQMTVKGGVGKVIEYYGEGVKNLTVPQRATITNMGAELGATSSIFPSDEVTREFLRQMGREEDFVELKADVHATYDEYIEVDLNNLVPLVACPSMPDKIKSVDTVAKEMAGVQVDQVCIGSCTNSSYSDIVQVARILKGKKKHRHTDIFLSAGSAQVMEMLAAEGHLETLIQAGVRILESACGPCIGMGASPISGGLSVRTFNRNFEGRSGTKDAGVYLASPVVAAYCGIYGRFVKTSEWEKVDLEVEFPKYIPSIKNYFYYPEKDNELRRAKEIVRGPNIVALEDFEGVKKEYELEALIKVGDDITTDHIMPAGAEITALRSNIPAISKHVFERVDALFYERAKEVKAKGKNGIIVAGSNYGQGSSREHAALAPRHLGVMAVLAKSFARIHRANLVNFGIIPLLFVHEVDYDVLAQGMECKLCLKDFAPHEEFELEFGKNIKIKVLSDINDTEWKIIQAGGFLNYNKTLLNK